MTGSTAVRQVPPPTAEQLDKALERIGAVVEPSPAAVTRPGGPREFGRPRSGDRVRRGQERDCGDGRRPGRRRGLASGLAPWAGHCGAMRIAGVGSAQSPGVSSTVQAGTVADVPIRPPVADGITGHIEAGCITPSLLQDAEFTSGTDAELLAAMRWPFTGHGLTVEGAGACPILAGRVQPTGTVVAVLAGRNIPLPTYLEAQS
ncbi:PALP domain-containing protein [Actinomadura formosensis]|uniref:hypothetical protein n=1 Tax=Actinomadura formosensis TaxID=60706 RepID=UPI000A730CEE|nr:hypothetical protein [Actinomadura formosensis]